MPSEIKINIGVEYRWWFQLLLPVLKWLIARGWFKLEWIEQIAKAGVKMSVQPSGAADFDVTEGEDEQDTVEDIFADWFDSMPQPVDPPIVDKDEDNAA